MQQLTEPSTGFTLEELFEVAEALKANRTLVHAVRHLLDWPCARGPYLRGDMDAVDLLLAAIDCNSAGVHL